MLHRVLSYLTLVGYLNKDLVGYLTRHLVGHLKLVMLKDLIDLAFNS